MDKFISLPSLGRFRLLVWVSKGYQDKNFVIGRKVYSLPYPVMVKQADNHRTQS